MKKDVHPEYHPVVFKDGEHEIVTRSTATSDETREIDGVEHYVISVDISAFSHPFYTGQKKLVDTEGRVDRFFNRYDLDKPEEESEDDEEAEATEGEPAAEADADSEEETADEDDPEAEVETEDDGSAQAEAEPEADEEDGADED